MSETVLVLARHGATSFNLKRPYVLQGRHIDPELAPLGMKQAAALGEDLAALPIRAVFASPLLRSKQTAEAVAKEKGLDVSIVEDITEADVGKWEGQSWATLPAEWAEARRLHDDDPSIHGYPDGENFTNVRDRSVPALEKLAREFEGQTFVVVGHNVVNRVCLAHWTGVPIRYSRRIPQNNAGYNVVVFTDGVAHVQTINAARHLSGLLPPD